MCWTSRGYILQACQYFTWTLLLRSHDVVMAGVCDLGWGLPWKRYSLKGACVILKPLENSRWQQAGWSFCLFSLKDATFMFSKREFNISICLSTEHFSNLPLQCFWNVSCICGWDIELWSDNDFRKRSWPPCTSMTEPCLFFKQCRLKITGILRWRLALSAYGDF